LKAALADPTPVQAAEKKYVSDLSRYAMKTAIVIGVGPNRGLGAQLCKRLASDGLNVIVAGRTKSALEAVANDIAASGGKAVAVVADTTNEADIVALFDRAGEELDLAIYNAGNNTPGRIVDMDAAYFEQSWRVVCFGGFLFGREAVRRMLPRKAGTLLFTGASASLRGRTGFGAFNSAKAGLRILAQAMAKEYAGDGIHVGHVIVDGAIGGDKIFQRFPDLASKEESLVSIEGIVDAFTFLYKQPPRAWSFEVDVRTSQEKW
jgi:NAD(P)-dependent dehydrogenase (short-subunit alcohol dehydrogenase family)